MRALGLVFVLLALLGFIFLVVFWVSQFLSLMDMKDEEFPGRYDKPLRYIAMVFGCLPGALVFWFWKRRRASSRKPVHEETSARGP